MSSDKKNDNSSPALCQQSGKPYRAPFFSFDQLEKHKLLEEFQRAGIKNNPWLLSLFSRYRVVYDCTPITFLILDDQGYIIDANRAARTLFSYSQKDLKGLNITKLVHKRDLKPFTLFLKNILNSNEKHRLELRIKQDNKLYISVVCHGCAHNIQGIGNEIFLILQDISQQKESEKSIFLLNKKLEQKICDQTSELIQKNKNLQEKIIELKKSKKQILNKEIELKSIFNAALEGILIINNNGDIESVNTAVKSIFGYTSDELIGYDIDKLIPSRQHTLQNHFFHDYLQKHQEDVKGKTWELEGQRKDGSFIPIEISAADYTLDHTQYFTCIIRDISARKSKELLDKQHLDELSHVTRLGLMGEMASGIAHEVNQPLTAIATYCHVCLQMIKEDVPDLKSLHDTLEKAEQQALRAGKIIARMREFVTSNPVKRSSSDINTLIQNALDLASDDCCKFSIEQKIELTEDLPFISVNSIQIEQVLLNLIKNSIDALIKSPKSTIRQISIQSYLIENKTIEVRVKDNGSGISKEDQAKIFTPFYTTKESGMGMGLSICQSLINAHNGELRFNCSQDRGTTFYFTLPVNSVGIKNA